MSELLPPGDRPIAARIATMVMAALPREYPTHVSHLLRGAADALPPRELTPAFYGSFDWHSAVHGHWCLARLLRGWPGAPFEREARALLGRHLTPERIAREVEYLEPPERRGFERPYGLAWLLQLVAELREWEDREAARWRQALEPLEGLAVARFSEWLPKLPRPVRSGEHSQTAFALGLAWDWARGGADAGFAGLVAERARAFYLADRAAPIAYEPSGHDFLSPALGEADLMRRVLAAREFPGWLGAFLPELGSAPAAGWLEPAEVADPADGKLAHLDGLNLSRAWMLEGVQAALEPSDSRRSFLGAAARRLRDAGLRALGGSEYAGTHWLGTFAAYLLTRRGLG